MRFDSYAPEEFYDELFISKNQPRPEAKLLIEKINSFSTGELLTRQEAAQVAMMKLGATFNVYSDS